MWRLRAVGYMLWVRFSITKLVNNQKIYNIFAYGLLPRTYCQALGIKNARREDERFCSSPADIYCFLNSFSIASLAGFTYVSLSFGFSILPAGFLGMVV